MGSFGDRLRREREQRGISLDDIALSTKIRAGLLQALEEEKFDRLPGGIFNKGFVRAYARHLGLDEDQTVSDYLVAAGETPVRRPAEGGGRGEAVEPRIQLVREEAEADSSEGSSPGVRGLFAGLVVLALVGASAWFYYHRERRAEIPAPPEAVATTVPVNSGSSTPPPATSSNPAENSAAPLQSPPAPAPSEVTSPAASKSALPLVQSSTPAGAFTVQLKADEECWVQITADGKSQEATLEAGLEKTITAKNRLTVRAGSVGALNIFFNGRKLPPQGEYGQVKTLVFGPSGIEATVIKPGEAAPTANP